MYRLAMVGSGVMARRHARFITNHPECDLATLCVTPRRRESARELCREFDVAALTTDFQDVLSDDSIDVIVLCTPDGLHPEQTVASLAAGKHVFCEKPLARRAEEFDRIEAALGASGKIVQVGMNCRYREQYSIPQRRIASGEFGALRFFRGTYIVNMVSSLAQGERVWQSESSPDLHPLLHGGAIHCVDLMRWIGGDVASVFASAIPGSLRETMGLDSVLAVLRFASGATGELVISFSAARANNFSLEAWMADGAIIGQQVHQWDGTSGQEVDPIAVKQERLDLELQLEAFVQAIRERKQPMNSVAEARRNFQIITAIVAAVQSNPPMPVG